MNRRQEKPCTTPGAHGYSAQTTVVCAEPAHWAPEPVYSEDRYESAVSWHEDAKTRVLDAKLKLEQAEDDLDRAEQALREQEAYPGIAAWAHQKAHEPGGSQHGYECTLPTCRIHGGGS